MNETPRRRTAFPVNVAKNTCCMLTLTRHEIHHAYNYPNTNNYLHSHTYLHDNTTLGARINPLILLRKQPKLHYTIDNSLPDTSTRTTFEVH